MVDALKHFYSDILHTYIRGKRGLYHTIVSPNLLQDNTIIQGGHLPVYQGFQYDHRASCLDFHVLNFLRLPTHFPLRSTDPLNVGKYMLKCEGLYSKHR